MTRIVLVTGILLILAGCSQYEPVVWIGGNTEIARNDSDQAVGLRAGLKGEDIEIGVSSNWFVSTDCDAPQTFGLYGIYHLPEPIIVAEVESMVYVGAQIGLPELDLDNDDGAIMRAFCGMHLPYYSYVEVSYDRYSGDIAAALEDKEDAQVTLGWRIPIK